MIFSFTSNEWRLLVRMPIVGTIGFAAAELLYGSRGPDSGALQFIPTAWSALFRGPLSSWPVHRAIDKPAMA